ncbi:DUF6089 family protein [Chitinophaga sp.]|uniref:type IX secretion system protein PorG n=1 Tax=Chitinophaga sp. TaxID=1869181 RepID=UPI00261ABB12|nr:DUF6089 family protein [uncultured Chitinophaga sp.]
MKKITGIVLLLAAPFVSKSQDWHIGGTAGISNYNGDLTEKRIDFKHIGPMIGLQVKRDINRWLTLRGGVTFGLVSGDDKDSEGIGRRARNLSFKSPVFEGHVGAELNILDIDDKGFTPYIFGGVGLFGFNPSANDVNGNRIYLQPLGTEGQGLAQCPERGSLYSLAQVAIPFGAGFKYLLSDKFTIGLEVGLRATFTDYLDDVSTTYVDQNTLLAERGQLAVDMAWRGDELHGGSYPLDGAQRGSDKNKDWYAFSGVTFMYRLGSSGGNRSTKFSKCFRM